MRATLTMRSRWLGAVVGCLFAFTALAQGQAKIIEKLPDFGSTPQLASPLQPFQFLPREGKVKVHAAIATIPDPLETYLGRTFDMGLAAVLSALQSQGYALDGFSLPWKPIADGKKAATTGPDLWLHRTTPGVLTLRREPWRHLDPSDRIVEYYVVFLVGEAPSYGIQPEAFARAAKCALFYGTNSEAVNVGVLQPGKNCDVAVHAPSRSKGKKGVAKPGHISAATLDILGPSFSGSMQSIVIAVASMPKPPAEVRLLSASATVTSNQQIVLHEYLLDKKIKMKYATLAASLDVQIETLLKYLCERQHDLSGINHVEILAEESTFGEGAMHFGGEKKPDDKCKQAITVAVKQFPPNISSIRAEHSRLRKQKDGLESSLQVVGRRLLELDMSSSEHGDDRPPVYQSELTSRSDELMLYRLFDAMRIWTKPDVVVIVATDVRDRLFLLGEIRNALPSVLPVMVGLDFLEVHPDYRKSSRGALVIASGDPMVCIKDFLLTPCIPTDEDKEAAKRNVTGGKNELFLKYGLLSRFLFATDFAANAFAATVLLVNLRSGRMNDAAVDDAARRAPCGGKSCDSLLRISTLSGFVDRSGWQNSVVAAQYRMTIQRPTYTLIGLLAVLLFGLPVWLWHGRFGTARVFLPYFRHLVLDPRWVFTLCKPASWRQRKVDRHSDAVKSLVPQFDVLCYAVMLVMASAVLCIAVRRLIDLWPTDIPGFDQFKLAHGRDVRALLSIWLLLGCICIVTHLRLVVVDRRHHSYRAMYTQGPLGPAPSYWRQILAWILPVLVILLVGFAFFDFKMTPVSSDRRGPWVGALIALAIGVGLLGNLIWQLLRFRRVTLFLERCIPAIRLRPGLDLWPAASTLGEMQQTPFNLNLSRSRDLPALLKQSPEQWARLTACIVEHGVESHGDCPPMNRETFLAWQAQLVAELKLHVVTMRGCAWCAMLAPISILLGIAVFPPIYERLITSLAILLLIVAFAVTVYVVLSLETDPMLGRIFTPNGDALSFGGAVRALWPKFVAMGLVLIPLVLPDAWSWIQSTIRQINSFN